MQVFVPTVHLRYQSSTFSQYSISFACYLALISRYLVSVYGYNVALHSLPLKREFFLLTVAKFLLTGARLIVGIFSLLLALQDLKLNTVVINFALKRPLKKLYNAQSRSSVSLCCGYVHILYCLWYISWHEFLCHIRSHLPIDVILRCYSTLMLFHNQRKQDGEHTHADNRYKYIFTRL